MAPGRLRSVGRNVLVREDREAFSPVGDVTGRQSDGRPKITGQRLMKRVVLTGQVQHGLISDGVRSPYGVGDGCPRGARREELAFRLTCAEWSPLGPTIRHGALEALDGAVGLLLIGARSAKCEARTALPVRQGGLPNEWARGAARTCSGGPHRLLQTGGGTAMRQRRSAVALAHSHSSTLQLTGSLRRSYAPRTAGEIHFNT